jgi:hypothetical protein
MKTKTLLIVGAVLVALYFFKPKAAGGTAGPILGGVGQ